MTFWKRQDCKDRKQISGGQELGVGERHRGILGWSHSAWHWPVNTGCYAFVRSHTACQRKA